MHAKVHAHDADDGAAADVRELRLPREHLRRLDKFELRGRRRRRGLDPAAAESHPAAKTGRRPSRKGSDGEAAHSIQPTPDAMRRPRGAAATTPNWHPTTAPDREASEPAVAGDGIGAANVASIPFEEPKTPPAPGIAAGGIACSSTAGWTYSNVHVGSSASVNTKSWSYPRCVALPSSARGGGDDARGGGALPFAATDVALEVLLPLSLGVRVIRVGEGVGEKSRRLPETVTSTAPSRSPAGSTQRTSTDAGGIRHSPRNRRRPRIPRRLIHRDGAATGDGPDRPRLAPNLAERPGHAQAFASDRRDGPAR